MADNWVPSAGAASSVAAPSWYCEITPQSWRVLGLAGLGWMFDVYDSLVLSLTIPALVAAFALSNAQTSTIGSILAAGLIVGGVFVVEESLIENARHDRAPSMKLNYS